jgi:hypothetical protein
MDYHYYSLECASWPSWLIDFNPHRPHKSFAYLTPVDYIEREIVKIRSLVVPM